MRYIRQIWEARATERFAILGLDWPKVRYIRQICITIISFFAASIGEVRNCRQFLGSASGSYPPAPVCDQASRRSKVRNCRQIEGAMGGAKIARSHINR